MILTHFFRKLDKNSLTKIPFTGYLPLLTSISVSHNKITHIQRGFWNNLPSLESLNISHNHITNISAGTFPDKSDLLSLNMNYNRIFLVRNGSFDGFKKLLDLKLSRNNLSNLGKELFRYLRNLKSLELNSNALTRIDGLTFKGLERLLVLKLRQNSIMSLLDGAFYGLHNLHTLRLDKNSITVVSKVWIYGLNSLRELYLGQNKIQEIERDAWDSCSNLLYLDLSHNLLQVIGPSTFNHLSKLQRLKLDHNRIRTIHEGAFNMTPSLRYLDLGNNYIAGMIEDTSGAFHGLKLLLNLSLATNEVTSINQKAFIGLDSLVNLDLSENKIKSIQENAFNNMPLKEISINTNSLLCDCALSWLPSWFQRSSVQLPDAYCGYPGILEGKRVTEIPPSNFLCSENDRPKPIITKIPLSVISISGSQVKLQCSASSSSNSTLNFKWKRNNDDIAPSHSSVVNNTSILHFPSVSLSNAGKYQCIVSNNFGTVYSHKANLTVLVLPTLTKKPGNITVRTGSTARLECAAVGEPTPQVGWQKDGGTEFPAAQERRMHVMPTDDVFFIINTKPADSGLYSCIARNSAGTVTANATLTVLEAPSFTKQMKDKEVGVGKSVVLECLASGWPKPKLRWCKDGIILQKSQRHIFTTGDQLLIIMDIQPSDAGIYQCEITNSLGTEKGISHITIVPAYGSTHEDMTGVIIITIGCCAVGTSAIWVIIIYQTRKRLRNSDRSKPITAKSLHLDTKSEHSASSKDSGTGDSTKRSNEDLRINHNGCLHNYSEEGETVGGEAQAPLMPLLNSYKVTLESPPAPELNQSSNSTTKIREHTRSNHDRCSRPCSTPLSKSTLSLTSIPHPNSYLCLYVPPKPAQV